MNQKLFKLVLAALFALSTLTSAQSSPTQQANNDSQNQDGTVKTMCCISNGGKGG